MVLMVGESSITRMFGREGVKVWLMVEVCSECVLVNWVHVVRCGAHVVVLVN